ncbi:hypothetical protein [Streptomyces sp. NPDC096142]
MYALVSLPYPTRYGPVYVVERTAKPLSSYGSVRLSGSTNQARRR